MSAPGEQPLALVRCPQCGADLAPEQDWCLSCGAPARTRIAPTPNWRVPAVAAVVAVLVAGGGLAYAFVKLSGDNGTVATTSSALTTPAPGTATVPAATVAPAAAAPGGASGATGATPTVTATTPSTSPTVTATTPATPQPGGGTVAPRSALPAPSSSGGHAGQSGK